jgi:hypothetical protein
MRGKKSRWERTSTTLGAMGMVCWILFLTTVGILKTHSENAAKDLNQKDALDLVTVCDRLPPKNRRVKPGVRFRRS